MPVVWLIPSSPGKWMAFSDLFAFCIFFPQTKKLKCWDKSIILGHEKVMVTLRIIKRFAAPIAGTGASSVWATGSQDVCFIKDLIQEGRVSLVVIRGPVPHIYLALTWECIIALRAKVRKEDLWIQKFPVGIVSTVFLIPQPHYSLLPAETVYCTSSPSFPLFTG